MRYPTQEEMELWLKVATGKHVPVILPNPITAPAVAQIDLHHLTVHSAYMAVTSFIEKSKNYDLKRVVVITGRSGQIKKEFPHWVSSYRFNELPNGGSFEIYIG